ncbi:MAG: SH3 domain-containing protein [Deltaproteobacteria bacterium]|nr:SH3 domain-containing protein [Deltaproteobacteria bacterium]
MKFCQYCLLCISCLIIITGTTLFAASGDEEIFYVKANSLNVRAEPSLKAKIVGKLKKGQKVTLYDEERKGFWVKIVAPFQGYVSIKYLISTAEKEKAIHQSIRYVLPKTLQVWSQPDNQSNPIDTLKYLQEVKVVKKTKDGKWWKIASPSAGYVPTVNLISREQQNQLVGDQKSCQDALVDVSIDASSLIAGLNFGSAVPQSKIFKTGTATGVFVDQHHALNPWIGFRLALNRMEANYKQDESTTGSDYKLTVTTSYLAYKPSFRFFNDTTDFGIINNLRVNGLFGFGIVDSELENVDTADKETTSGVGLVMGAGLASNWNSLVFGFEYLLINQKSSFTRSGDVYTGSNQILITVAMQF